MHAKTEGETLERLTKQVAKGGGIAFIGQLVGRFFTLVLQIMLTRVLGVGSYGLYALGNSVLGIAHTVSMLGLHNGVVRFGAMNHGSEDKAKLKGTFLSALVLSFSSASVITLVLYFLAGAIAEGVFHEANLTNPLKAFSFALPFYTLVTMTSFCARALRRIDYDVAISHLLRPIFTLLAVGASFLLGYKLMGAVTGFVISMVISAGLGLYLLQRLFPEITSKVRVRCETRTLILYSLTVLLVGLSHLLISRTDRIMLGILGSAEDVGIYNAAATMSVQATLFLLSFNAIFAPTIANLFHKQRMEELATLFKTTTKWIFTLTIPVVLVFVLFAWPIMRVFGPGFSAGALVLISLGIAELLNAGVGGVALMLTMSGHQKIELLNSLSLGVLNVVLNLLLIPMFHVLGAAIATGASIALINLVRVIEVYLLYKVHPYKLSYWKPIVAGGVATLVWIGVRSIWNLSGWMWLGGSALFGVIYMLTFMALGLDDEDKVIMRAVKKRILRQQGING
jgi:O-antigen/teichoic acid export membrane protein